MTPPQDFLQFLESPQGSSLLAEFSRRPLLRGQLVSSLGHGDRTGRGAGDWRTGVFSLSHPGPGGHCRGPAGAGPAAEPHRRTGGDPGVPRCQSAPEPFSDRGRDDQLLLASFVNQIRELFEAHDDATGLAWLDQLEEE